MSDKLKFYSYISDYTDFTPQDWIIGDKITLPVLFGRAIFTIESITPERISLISGKISTTFKKVGDIWRWNHVLVDTQAVAKIQFT